MRPVWIYKVRKSKGSSSKEKVVRIPPEISEQLGEYVRITIQDGKLVIEPYNKNQYESQ